nr:hypothetical protein [Tanacetum cinerariifolium]
MKRLSSRHIPTLLLSDQDFDTPQRLVSGLTDLWFQELLASQEVKKDVSSLRYIALPNWAHDALLEFSSSKPQDHCSTEVPEGSGNTNPTAFTPNLPADHMETLIVETPIPTVSSPVLTAYSTDSQDSSSDARIISKKVANQEETPSLDNILSLTNRFEDILEDTTNSDESNRVEADEQVQREPKKTFDALQDPSWVEAKQEELLQNSEGHTQEEGINYDEVFAPVARIEAIRLFLAYASFMGFTVYQMDVKSAFFYGTIDEEVYVMQPPRFQDLEYPTKVYKVEKAMYGLHQAPRAWYGTLSKYLLKNGFQKGTIDQTLFIRRKIGDFILVQVYVDDIIFGSSNPQLCREFEALMHEKFQMSDMGELNFFLGLQVLQKEDGIFLSQDKYVGDILKKFGYSDVRSSNTLMDKENPRGKDGTRKDVDLHLYRSMIGSLMYLTASRPDIISPVPTAYSTDSQDSSSDARLISKRVANQEKIPSLDNILSLTNQFEDILGGTTNSDESNGIEADVSNLETTITASPTPTLRIHKDHPKSQIIGPVDTPIQTRNKSKEVWNLVDCPKGVRPIGTKWVLKNKKDERGIVIRNKARLVAQGHTQEEGSDYDEVFAPVARIKAIRLFLAYASFMGFTVYQMDVKSAFLYGTIDEEVNVMQPPGFQDPENLGIQMSDLQILPWTRRILGGKDGTGKDVDLHLYRSMIGSLMYLTASRPDIMFAVCACARHQVTPKECHLHAVKRIFRYLKGHPKLGLWYPKDSPFDLVAYSDSDYGGATQDRKSTTRGC